MLRENLNEIKCLGMELKKTIIKRIGTKLDIKIQWKEMIKDGIKEKKINQEIDWKKKELKEWEPNLIKKKTNKIKQLGTKWKNKIQLETVNINKTIAIKRRRTKSKEKRNWSCNLNDVLFDHCLSFCLAALVDRVSTFIKSN